MSGREAGAKFIDALELITRLVTLAMPNHCAILPAPRTVS